MKARSVYYCNYTIGEDAYGEAAQVCRLYGKRILLIGGKKGLEAGSARLREKLAGTELEIVETVWYGEDCTYKNMDRLCELAKRIQADMIFGMGGGKALDTAKGAGVKAGIPVFTFPTIAATCAATTALSVVYREDGNFDSFFFYVR